MTKRPPRGPGKTASRDSVLGRLRRLDNETGFRREAKRLAREENNTLAAMEMLRLGGDVNQAHVNAHVKWLATQYTPEDLA